jgi:hypothetical protein
MAGLKKKEEVYISSLGASNDRNGVDLLCLFYEFVSRTSPVSDVSLQRPRFPATKERPS